GHPMHLDGEESEMAAEAARFATRIHKALGIPTELYDERLTSWAADQMLAEDGAQGLSRGRHKTAATRRGQSTARSTRAAKDHFAAAILLRDFLDNKNARSSGKV
ncbi:MAG: Holliday junction resolvase RuvX, partial [Acidobacteria bacterium]|nr:Holliday junction resolvase RuvX [Acidobacteriota bacterium]